MTSAGTVTKALLIKLKQPCVLLGQVLEANSQALRGLANPLIFLITMQKPRNALIKRSSETSASAPLPRALAIDFFCGAGGTTNGFIDAGIRVIAGIDMDEGCRDTYCDAQNNKNPDDGQPPMFLAYDVRPKSCGGQQEELLAELGKLIDDERQKYPGRPLIFSICAPCQPFTEIMRTELDEKTASRRDADAELIQQTIIFIEHFQPEAIFSENVPGISKEHRYGPILANFIESLKALDYAVGTQIINAKDFGVPQNRRRRVVLARKSRPTKREQLNKGGVIDVPQKDEAASRVTVAEVLGTKDEPAFPAIAAGETDKTVPNHIASDLSLINKKRLRYAYPGKPNSVLANTPEGDLRVACHQKDDKLGNKNHHCDVYTRMDPSKVAPTITTKCYSISNGRYGYPYMNQNRAISLREAAVLQSFPSDYRFHPLDKITRIGKQIGNAVPPQMAKFFGSYLLETTRHSQDGDGGSQASG